MARNIVILGATSAIAQSIAKNYAVNGDNIFLVGRNSKHLEMIKQDLQARYAANIHIYAMDFNLIDTHQALLKKIEEEFNSVDILLIAYGSLPNQKKCESSFAETSQELMTNFISVTSLLTLFANYFEKRKTGTIAVISSVAGDRGRQSNYVYGSAKGGLTIFLQGLRNRLSKSNIHVLTIKPGFVDTPMTKDLKKGILFAKPDYVGTAIVKAIDKKRNVIYTPFFWRYVMCIIKSIPEKIFCRMAL